MKAMRNLEVYEESLMENYLNSNYNYVGVEEKTGEMRICKDIKCSECSIGKLKEENKLQKCSDAFKIWANEEYRAPMAFWEDVDVDTPILVRDYPTDCWHKAHFAKYKDGNVLAFKNGKTSWSVDQYSSLIEWKYAKLAESEENVE